ncbi:hypothetical protein T4D_5680 [Trichinella pseudospiralis]|uniref:Uncharacterized protein n=1 Tax=Trichinella pseudospiralis TaxID=6337 RepID=A0A0V1FLT3_TRIPS|nr:hypothetical protein T4D_5680 [Trichinella pseudospiralis]
MFISGAHLRQRKSLEQKKGKAFFTCSLHNSFKTPLFRLIFDISAIKRLDAVGALCSSVGCSEFSTRITHTHIQSPPLSSFRLLQHEEPTGKNELRYPPSFGLNNVTKLSLFINEILTKSLCLSMFTRLPQDLLVV